MTIVPKCIRLPGAGLLAVLLLGTSPAEVGGLVITYLANSGFHLRGGKTAVVVDGLVPVRYSRYGAVPDSLYQALLDGSPPLGPVSLELVSHVHKDHFLPDATRDFLERHSRCRLVSSPQAVALAGGAGADSTRLETVLPEPGGRDSVRVGDVLVEFLRFRHGSSDNYEMQSLGHVLHFGGRTVLHLGDAEPAETLFAAYGMDRRRFDVALVPYWYLLDPRGLDFVQRYLHADLYIACHIPPEESYGFVEARERGLRVESAERPGQTWTF